MNVGNRKWNENNVDKQSNLKINDLISKSKEKVMVKQTNNNTKDLDSSNKKIQSKTNVSNSTYNSHSNQSKFLNKKKCLNNDDTSSESDYESETSFNDGPLILAPNPNEKYLKNRKSSPPAKQPVIPQRIWEMDPLQNLVTNINQNQATGNNTTPPTFVNLNNSPPRYNNRNENSYNNKNNNNNKPNCIRENSYIVSTENEHGEVRIEDKSILHDGFEVYHSTAYKKRLKRMEKLNSRMEKKDLISAKRPVGTRFILTNVSLDITEEDVEDHLFKDFEWLSNVYIRRCRLKHDKFASFVFIVYEEEEVDPKIFENHRWPGRIRCFFSPNDRGYQR